MPNAETFAERYAADAAQAKPRILLVSGLWAYSVRSQYEHHDERHDKAGAECHRRNIAEGRYRRFWTGR